MRRPALLRRLACRLLGETRGAAAVEFAIIAPTMMIVLMGASELAYQSYVQSMLDGAIQKAGRDSAIQGGGQNTAAIDAKVFGQLGQIAKRGTLTSTRKSYSTFSQIKPESFTDTNNNGVRDAGECFEDVNGNGAWDADPGKAGQGGADDVTVYELTLTMPHLFPVWGILGWSVNETLKSRTVLKNQPYASQTVVTPKTVCT